MLLKLSTLYPLCPLPPHPPPDNPHTFVHGSCIYVFLAEDLDFVISHRFSDFLVRFGLSHSVRCSDVLRMKLRIFEVVGRISLKGLYLMDCL